MPKKSRAVREEPQDQVQSEGQEPTGDVQDTDPTSDAQQAEGSPGTTPAAPDEDVEGLVMVEMNTAGIPKSLLGFVAINLAGGGDPHPGRMIAFPIAPNFPHGPAARDLAARLRHPHNGKGYRGFAVMTDPLGAPFFALLSDDDLANLAGETVAPQAKQE